MDRGFVPSARIGRGWDYLSKDQFFLFQRNGYSLVNLHELFWKKDIHKKRTLPLVPSPSLKQMMVHFLSRPTSMWVLVARWEAKLLVLREETTWRT